MNSELYALVELETLFSLVDELDYYQLLKVPSSSTSEEISNAFRKERAQKHPDRFAALGNSTTKEQANYIFTAIDEASRVLKDPEQRLIYDALLTQGQIRMDDTKLKKSVERASSNDPLQAATTEQTAADNAAAGVASREGGPS